MNFSRSVLATIHIALMDNQRDYLALKGQFSSVGSTVDCAWLDDKLRDLQEAIDVVLNVQVAACATEISDGAWRAVNHG